MYFGNALHVIFEDDAATGGAARTGGFDRTLPELANSDSEGSEMEGFTAWTRDYNQMSFTSPYVSGNRKMTTYKIQVSGGKIFVPPTTKRFCGAIFFVPDNLELYSYS